MQNRYTGDIGDFAKYGLLRKLGKGHLLGVAWYLFPDELHNKDGCLTAYLENPKQWRHLDEELFDGLGSIVRCGRRNVQQIETSCLLNNAVFSDNLLKFEGDKEARARKRAGWFQTVLSDLSNCSVVFADPDNGLCEDCKYDMSDRRAWKRLPLSEAHVLGAGRTGVIYHHNTRWPGGHKKEIQHWLTLLGADTLALYWKRSSQRTFFIVHPTREINRRVQEFTERWSPNFELHKLDKSKPPHKQRVDNSAANRSDQISEHKVCPECEHEFKGKGWGGIDAHWKANHEGIMSYEEAWPIIKEGAKPSTMESSE